MRWLRVARLIVAAMFMIAVAPLMALASDGCREGDTYVTYACDSNTCYYVRCVPTPCEYVAGHEGTKIVHRCVNGMWQDEWWNSPCGTCGG